MCLSKTLNSFMQHFSRLKQKRYFWLDLLSSSSFVRFGGACAREERKRVLGINGDGSREFEETPRSHHRCSALSR